MRLDDILSFLESFPGTVRLDAGGDSFFIHDPARDLPPQRQQPWATVVTTNAYDDGSDLDRDGVFRVNVGLTRNTFQQLDLPQDPDFTALDVLLPHPTYGALHWVCVLTPDTLWPTLAELAAQANTFAVRKYDNATRRERTG